MLLSVTFVPLRDILVTLKLPLWSLMEALVPLRRAVCSQAEKNFRGRQLYLRRKGIIPLREAKSSEIRNCAS